MINLNLFITDEQDQFLSKKFECVSESELAFCCIISFDLPCSCKSLPLTRQLLNFVHVCFQLFRYIVETLQVFMLLKEGVYMVQHCQ